MIRQLGPIIQAFREAKDALYRPPRTVIDLPNNLFPDPLQPVQPMGPPGAEPLSFSFNFGQNLSFTPRTDAFYSAGDLRYYSRYPIARICIENNKDMLTRMDWRVQLKPLPGETSKARAERSKNDEKIVKLNNFFERPNQDNNWSDFIRPVLEDMLVIDAPSVFVGRTINGEVAELRWVDGASIVRMVDEHGWTPKPPYTAYQQLWEGYPRVDLSTDQLIYKPRNIVPRSGSIASYLYGCSPTEQIVDEIKVGQARLEFIYNFYAEGNIPGGLLFAPVGTSPDKIREAQQWLDSDLAGQLAKRRRLQILQGFQADGNKEQVIFPKEPTLSDIFDEAHIRKICFAYGTSPQRLMRMMNRASAQVSQDSAQQEGTLPFLNWLKGLMDHIVQIILKEPDYEFAFEPFRELDQLKQSMADERDIKVGLYTRNEIRERRGDDPRPEPEADELNITTANGVLGLDEKPQVKGFGGRPGGATSSGTSASGAARSQRGSSGGTAAAKANGGSDLPGSTSTH